LYCTNPVENQESNGSIKRAEVSHLPKSIGFPFLSNAGICETSATCAKEKMPLKANMVINNEMYFIE
jgi:hypothetical protein